MTRWKMQALATLLTNANVGGFLTGKIYKGKLKSICIPGLNCYSCPGAVSSCPIGALQAVLGSSKFIFSYYIVGLMTLFGVLFGRLVCGFLCPFGWFQELLHLIPSKKCSTRNLSKLTYLKYIILLLFVIVLPMTIVNDVGMGDPWFCKWLCPVGILEGAMPLSIVNSGIRAALGSLFAWKSGLLLGCITLSLFFYRPFCKWLCPLGAFYALFNKLSFYQFSIDQKTCTSCASCSKVCKMDVSVNITPNHTECIRCGDCIKICPQGAIGTSKILRKENKADEKNNEYPIGLHLHASAIRLHKRKN